MKMKQIPIVFNFTLLNLKKCFEYFSETSIEFPEILQSDLIKFLDQVLFAKKCLIAKK